jgi:hypothetical protein
MSLGRNDRYGNLELMTNDPAVWSVVVRVRTMLFISPSELWAVF